jgi:hypothetical protein
MIFLLWKDSIVSGMSGDDGFGVAGMALRIREAFGFDASMRFSPPFLPPRLRVVKPKRRDWLIVRQIDRFVK